MSKSNVNVKVTKNGEILRLKTMFEVIDMAEEAWKDKTFLMEKQLLFLEIKSVIQ